MAKVSVPYWGSLYFNENDREITGIRPHDFPSPTGVLYISMLNAKEQVEIYDSFRPLLGVFIFQLLD